MDEPLSHLDATVRAPTRTDLARLQVELGATIAHSPTARSSR
ncbi:hypothetical protein [Nocardioides sp. GY 10113]|nr:hypothetical protein [Nocardioides sp. GY 10113]